MIKVCIGCEKEFEASRHDKMTCSGSCQRRVAWRRSHHLPLAGPLPTSPRQKVTKEPKPCKQCGKMFTSFRRDAQFCNELCGAKYQYYHRSRGATVQRLRICRRCKAKFAYDGSNRLYYCSDECARLAAIEKRLKNAKDAAQWRKEHPDAAPRYHKKRAEIHPEEVRGGITQRFFKKYSHIPKVCQACGEKRLVELAHKKPRNGAWRSFKNTTDKDVWILCPTCHRCLDFGIETKESLGLPD